MFQELLLADLCLVDMSIDNANVFYELGIRHAFRKRGMVHIQAGRSYMPFDVFNARTMRAMAALSLSRKSGSGMPSGVM